MSNCKKCFFCRVLKDQYGVIYKCYSDPKKPVSITIDQMRIEKCNNFGHLDKAIEMYNNHEKYEWKSFGKDKRTAHYRTSKKFQLIGADLYYTIYTWEEHETFWALGAPDEICNTFHWEKALVHYKDGSFKTHKFRSNIQNINNK